MGLKKVIKKAIDIGLDELGDLSEVVLFQNRDLTGFDLNTGKPIEASSSSSVEAFVTTFKDNEVDGTQIVVGDKRVYIRAKHLSFVPQNEDVIQIGGEDYQIKNIKDLGNLNHVYMFHVRGPNA